MAETEASILAMADRWVETVDRLSEAAFQESFAYSNTRGDQMSHTRGPVLAHVFNHATHHRGQISPAIAKERGGEYPVMDLLYFLNPQA